MAFSVTLVSKDLAAVEPHLLGHSIFALGFLSCLQCWIPPSVVLSFNNILATIEINFAVDLVSIVDHPD